VKRLDLEIHLRQAGCELFREGGKHSVWWNPKTGKTTSIPRHRELKDFTCRGICKQLEVPYVRG